MTWADRVERKPEPPRSTPAPRRAHPAGGTREEKYARAALDGECDAVRGEAEGNRNNRLNVAALRLGGLVASGYLDESEVREGLYQAGRAAGLGEHETRATLESGLRAGMREPRELPPPREGPGRRVHGRRSAPAAETTPDSELEPEADPEPDWQPRDEEAPDSPPGEPSSGTPSPEVALVPLATLVGPALDRAERRRAGDEVPVPVPWLGYAEALGGGFWPGAHFLVSGTAVGKSQLTIQTSLGAALAGIPVVYIGLELDEAQIALRALGEHARLRWSSLYLGRCSAEDLANARSAASTLEGLPFYCDFGPPRGWPASRLAQLAEAVRKRHPAGPMLMVLDYLQLVGDEATLFERRPDTREKIGAAAYAARDIARRFDASVIVVSSAARNHYGLLASDASEAGLVTRKLPGQFEPVRTILQPHVLVGLGKESGEVEFSADTVTTLIRWPSPLESGESAIVCAVPKVRCGIPRWLAFRFWGRFEELPCKSVDDLPEVRARRGGHGKPVAIEELEARVIATLSKHTGLRSKTAIAQRTTGTKRDLLETISGLIAQGRIALGAEGFEVREEPNR